MPDLPPSDRRRPTPGEGDKNLLIRRLTTLEEYQACVHLQEITWGRAYPDLVPTSILLVTQKIGGIVAGAFDISGTLVGFVFGMAGYRHGRPIHWSDMLAVHPDWRDSGVGTQLKFFQRAEVLKLGVKEIFWTFDPLVARNARFGLVRLGAEIDSYVPDMYVEGSDELHRGLGMDRCIAVWRIFSSRVEAIAAGRLVPHIEPAPDVPVVNSQAGGTGTILPATLPLLDAPAIRIEIPLNIHAIRDTDPSTARQWRESTRRAFQHYLKCGYHVSTLVRNPEGDRVYYLLTCT